jgi:hypothetical protein
LKCKNSENMDKISPPLNNSRSGRWRSELLFGY